MEEVSLLHLSTVNTWAEYYTKMSKYTALYLQIPTVKEEIRRYSSQYSARSSANQNDLIVNLIELPDNRRLRRHLPNDLPTRFLVQLLYL
jgi:hypothetical protein